MKKVAHARAAIAKMREEDDDFVQKPAAVPVAPGKIIRLMRRTDGNWSMRAELASGSGDWIRTDYCGCGIVLDLAKSLERQHPGFDVLVDFRL